MTESKYGVKSAIQAAARFAARALTSNPFRVGAIAYNVYEVTCRAPDGSVKWTDKIVNTTVNVGLDEILDKFWKGSTYTASHYVGLTNGSPSVAAADTMASHGGWTENQNYTEGTRVALTAKLGTVSGQSVDNSGTTADFSINTNTQTLGGVFITTDSTKGGTSGILIAAGAFTGGNKSADSGDTLSVTVTLTQASA